MDTVSTVAELDNMDSVISVDEFENACQESGDSKSEFEVFEEVRRSVDLQEFVRSVVEVQYTHPLGVSSVNIVGNLVYDEVYCGEFVPEELPESVKERFAHKLDAEVEKYGLQVFDMVNEEFHTTENYNWDEVRNLIDVCVTDVVPESY